MEDNEKINVEEIMKQIHLIVERKVKDGFYKEDLTELYKKDKLIDETGMAKFHYFLNEIKNNFDIRNNIVFTSHRKYYGGIIVKIKKFSLKIIFNILKNLFNNIVNFNFYVYSMLEKIINEISLIKLEKEKVVFKDYLAFENSFRGSEKLIRARQVEYLKYFNGRQNILDIGCGRGEFLELLKQNDISCTGIDVNPEMVNHCIEKKLNVKKTNAIDYLDCLLDNTLGGVFISQVIEHLSYNEILTLINLCYQKLDKDGIIIIETINPKSLITFANSFYMDLTHKAPIHPETLKLLLALNSFKISDLIYLSPVDEKDKLKLIKNPVTENEKCLNENFKILNNTIFGYQDYSIIAQK